MNDVAREASVALKTVSRYVNGETNVAPELGERIKEAIDRLGYRKNFAAASIRPGHSSRMLGLIIGDITNPYYSTLAQAIERTAREERYLLITASSEEDGPRHDDLVERLIEQQVEGFIVVPPRRPGRAWSQHLAPVPPVVFLDRPADAPGADTVVADNRNGARDATRQLLASAGPRIAFVGDSTEIYTMRERLAGYTDALTEAGHRPDDSLIRTTAHTSDDAASAVTELLRESPAIDGIFAANNRASVGALMAFTEAGRRVALIGFDDFEAATIATPRVSVVTQDIADMGRQSARLLIDRIRGKSEGGSHVVVPTRLLLRGSEKR